MDVNVIASGLTPAERKLLVLVATNNFKDGEEPDFNEIEGNEYSTLWHKALISRRYEQTYATDLGKAVLVATQKHEMPSSEMSYQEKQEIIQQLLTPRQPEPEDQFREELKQLINKYSKENGSNTPDLILASFLLNCLTAFDSAVQDREAWYGRPPAAPFEPVDASIKATL